MSIAGPLTHASAPTWQREDRRAQSVLLWLIASLILTQRLALPLGASQVPVTLVLTSVVLVLALLWGAFELDPLRTRLFSLATCTLVLLTLLSVARGQEPSALSVLFVVALYAPAAVRAPVLPAAATRRVLDAFLDLMALAACAGLLQAGLQLAGMGSRDWLADVVPAQFLVAGYNTGDVIEYGADFVRVNGVIFLEPSFYSYFLGLAAVIALYRGASTARLGLYLVAMVPSLAGNGVVILAAGCLAMAFGQHAHRLRRLVVPVFVAVVSAAVTPLGARVLARTTEVSESGSSSNLRLVEPYVRILPAWLQDPIAVLVGHGAGATTELLRVTGREVLAPVMPKLLYEYGVLGAVPFLLFVLWAVCAGRGERPWAAGLLVSYLFLNAALLQATLALTTILFVHLLRVDVLDRAGSKQPSPSVPQDARRP